MIKDFSINLVVVNEDFWRVEVLIVFDRLNCFKAVVIQKNRRLCSIF